MRGTPPHPRGNQANGKLLRQIQQLLIQLSLVLGVLADDLGAGLSPLGGVINLDHVAAFSLQLLQHLVLSILRQLAVVLLSQLAGFHNGSLLLFGQLLPSGVGDDHLNGAQGVTVQDQVVGNLGEGVGLVVGNGLLGAVNNAGLQSGVQLAKGNGGSGSAQAVDHAHHDGVIGNAELQAGQILDAGNGLTGEEVTEALFAVEDAPQGQADLLGLVQELSSQLGVSESPEVVAAGPGVGDGQQGSLLAAIGGQSKRGDTGDIDGVFE